MRKDERGASMIEFAIVALLLLTLIFGIIEFGWIFFGWITLTGAVREGARLAVLRDVTDDTIKDAVEKHAFSFQISREDIGIFREPTGIESTVMVSVTGDLPLLIGFFPINNPYNISVEAVMFRE